MIKSFGSWELNTVQEYSFFIHCRNHLVPEVKEGHRILWSVSRFLDADGVYRGSAILRGYYVKHERPAISVMPTPRHF